MTICPVFSAIPGLNCGPVGVEQLCGGDEVFHALFSMVPPSGKYEMGTVLTRVLYIVSFCSPGLFHPSDHFLARICDILAYFCSVV